jgi:hypothetical protein
MKTFLCELLFSCLLAAPGAKGIDELTYGTTLYAYYQQDYQQALLDVLVAERQGRTGEDPLRFELAKGSFAFQQGMFRLATETFDGVAQDELTELDQMRLAFHLSRQHYRRGDWGSLEAALAGIDLGANWRGRQRRHPEVTFMGAEAALARGDFAAAEAALAELAEGDEYLAYGLFNLGVAYRQAGDTAASHQAFSRLAGLKVTSEEAWDLVQRGRLALAVMARQTGDAVDAQAVLGTLPGEGRYRDLALASYGNLAMELEDHELAARIWLTLLEQQGWSSSRAMAHLGLPMSLEKVASTAHALERYRVAEQVFEQRLAMLQDAAARSGDPGWVAGLLDVSANPDDQARTRELGRFDDGFGTAAWLEWLSGEDVHQIMVEWRELNGMAAWLEGQPPRLAAFEEITAERRRRTGEARALLGEETLVGRRAELADRVAGLASDLNILEREPARPAADWMLRLASAQERVLIDELSAMSALVAEHMPAADRARIQARIDRLIGVVFWEIADEKAARVRALAKQLNDNRSLLADVDMRIERLAGAEARFAAGVESNFRVLSDRVERVSERVTAALEARRRVIAQALQRGLEQEMARTRQYLITARIAIARATDQLAAAPPGTPGGDS